MAAKRTEPTGTRRPAKRPPPVAPPSTAKRSRSKQAGRVARTRTPSPRRAHDCRLGQHPELEQTCYPLPPQPTKMNTCPLPPPPTHPIPLRHIASPNREKYTPFHTKSHFFINATLTITIENARPASVDTQPNLQTAHQFSPFSHQFPQYRTKLAPESAKSPSRTVIFRRPRSPLIYSSNQGSSHGPPVRRAVFLQNG